MLPQWASCLLLLSVLLSSTTAQDDTWVDVIVPPKQIDQEDTYVCINVDIPQHASRLIEVQPIAEQQVVHHMLLFGCDGIMQHDEDVWECLGHGICAGNQNFMWGWGKNAPAFTMPDNVSFAVGPGSGFNQLVLQVHYLTARPANDSSGVRIRFSTHATPMSAGVIAFASLFTIPPGRDEYDVVNHCCYRGYEPINTFAFRVHTHWMGRAVYMERTWNSSYTERLMENSPQLPQGFYPTGHHAIMPGDHITTTCVFNSSLETNYVSAGPTHANEMCNLYLMSYSQRPVFMSCYGMGDSANIDQAGGLSPHSTLQLPTADLWSPPPSVTPTNHPDTHTMALGQVTGVALGMNSTVWVLHRGTRAWEGDSFDSNTNRITYDSYIEHPTILLMDQDTGRVLRALGRNLLSMPHMITLGRDGALWVTDVGRHQVLKIDPETGNVLMAIGTEGEPGNGPLHLCKPTHVQLDADDNVYVSDGYCNARVAVYDAEGKFVKDLVLEGERGLLVPHSMVLDGCGGMLLVASREQKELVAFSLATGAAPVRVSTEQYGYPYAVTPGPYGTTLVLVWDRQINNSTLLVLGAGYRQVAAWHLPNVSAPHDIAAAAAIPELTGARERMLAVFVAETRPSADAQGSQLWKHVVVPDGVDLASMEQQAAGLLAARQEAEDVLAAAVGDSALEPEHAPVKSNGTGNEEDEEDASFPAPAPAPAAAAPVVAHGPLSSNLTGIFSGFGGAPLGIVGILGGVVAVTAVVLAGVLLVRRWRGSQGPRFEALPQADPDKLG